MYVYRYKTIHVFVSYTAVCLFAYACAFSNHIFWSFQVATPLIQPDPKSPPGSSPHGQRMSWSHRRGKRTSLDRQGAPFPSAFSPQMPTPLTEEGFPGTSAPSLPSWRRGLILLRGRLFTLRGSDACWKQAMGSSFVLSSGGGCCPAP